MKNIIIAILFILTLVMGCLCFSFYARGERIKQVVNYDIDKEHLIMRESGKYNYCPFCGEYIGDRK